MAIEKIERISSLWASFNEQHGVMGAIQCNGYVLTIQFMKCVSDKCEDDSYCTNLVSKDDIHE